MEIKTEVTERRRAEFTRAEILRKLGVDLDDFFHVTVDWQKHTLTLYYTSKD